MSKNLVTWNPINEDQTKVYFEQKCPICGTQINPRTEKDNLRSDKYDGDWIDHYYNCNYCNRFSDSFKIYFPHKQ